MAKKNITIISFSLLFIILASFATIYALRQKNIKAVGKFVDGYLKCTTPQNFGSTTLQTISQAEKYFADNARIIIKNNNQNTTTLSASQYLRELAKMNFTQTIQRTILIPPHIKRSLHLITIDFVEKYIMDGRISVSDTTMIIEKLTDGYLIKEIQQTFRKH